MTTWPPKIPTDLIKQVDSLEMYHPTKKQWLRVLSVTPCQRRTVWELLLRDTYKGKLLRRIFRSDGPLKWCPKKEDIIVLRKDYSTSIPNQDWLDIGCLYLEEEKLLITFNEEAEDECFRLESK